MYKKETIIKKLIEYLFPFVIIYIVELIFTLIRGRPVQTDLIISLLLGFFSGGIGKGSYYVPLLIQFIFLYPVIYWIIKRYNKKGLIMIFLLNILYEIMKFSFGIKEETYRLLIFRYLFLFGWSTYIFHNNYLDTLKGKGKFILSFVMGIAFIILNSYLGYKSRLFNMWTSTSLMFCFYIIPVFLITYNMIKERRNIILESIGKCSYHIFLFQMFYYEYCEARLRNLVSNNKVLLMLDFTICIIFGIIFYYIERPITRKLVNRFVNN